MPYDLCEDADTLDYIESEMAKRGQWAVLKLCHAFPFTMLLYRIPF